MLEFEREKTINAVGKTETRPHDSWEPLPENLSAEDEEVLRRLSRGDITRREAGDLLPRLFDLMDQRDLKPYFMRVAPFGKLPAKALKPFRGKTPGRWLWSDRNWLYEMAGPAWGEWAMMLRVLPAHLPEWHIVEYEGNAWQSHGPDDLVVVQRGRCETVILAMREAHATAADLLRQRTVIMRDRLGSSPTFRNTSVSVNAVGESLASGKTIDEIASATELIAAICSCGSVRRVARQPARRCPENGNG
jgi:hypothetical protein